MNALEHSASKSVDENYAEDRYTHKNIQLRIGSRGVKTERVRHQRGVVGELPPVPSEAEEGTYPDERDQQTCEAGFAY